MVNQFPNNYHSIHQKITMINRPDHRPPKKTSPHWSLADPWRPRRWPRNDKLSPEVVANRPRFFHWDATCRSQLFGSCLIWRTGSGSPPGNALVNIPKIWVQNSLVLLGCELLPYFGDMPLFQGTKCQGPGFQPSGTLGPALHQGPYIHWNQDGIWLCFRTRNAGRHIPTMWRIVGGKLGCHSHSFLYNNWKLDPRSCCGGLWNIMKYRHRFRVLSKRIPTYSLIITRKKQPKISRVGGVETLSPGPFTKVDPSQKQLESCWKMVQLQSVRVSERRDLSDKWSNDRSIMKNRPFGFVD